MIAAATTCSAPSTGRRAAAAGPRRTGPVRDVAQDKQARDDRGFGVLGHRQGQPSLGQRTGELRVKDVTSYFSLSESSVSERGYQIMHAAGIKPTSTTRVRLGSPSLLVSARRRQIIEFRDRHSAHREAPGMNGPIVCQL